MESRNHSTLVDIAHLIEIISHNYLITWFLLYLNEIINFLIQIENPKSSYTYK